MADPNNTRTASNLIQIADYMLIVFSLAQAQVSAYFDTGLSAAVNALSTDATPVPDTPFTKAELIQAVNLAQQFAKFMINDSPAPGIYREAANKVAAKKPLE